VAAKSREELLELLSSTLRALFPDMRRFELCAGDEQGSLLGSGAGRSAGAARGEPTGLGWLRDLGARGRRAAPRRGAGRGRRMAANLLDGTEQMGVLVVEASPGRTFDEVDLRILESVAHLYSLAFLRQSRRSSIELDRRAASSVQRRLMNRPLPAGAGVKVDAIYRPALDVGGDFYDLALRGDGRIGGTIGDVAGKGVAAALVMSRVSADMGRAIRSAGTPSQALEQVDSTLADGDTESFVTAACLSLDTRSRMLTVANAGHVPLLVRRENGEVLDFGHASGAPLGMVRCEYVDEHLELQPRDIVLLMTDGLVEAFDRPDDRMGAEALHRLVQNAPHDPKAINARLLAAADARQRLQPLDDVTLVAIQLDGR